MKTLKDKVVVITGAGSGIGRALAVQAAQMGAALALGDWNEPALAETARLVGGARALSRRVDVRSDAEIEGFAGEVQRELGGAHVVVNNAGVSASDTASEMKREDFEWVLDINFWGVVRGTCAFLPQLRAKDEAHVVNVSSIFGIIAVPSQSAYNASKFAVRGFTEALRQELEGTSVRVTCVHPGGIRTNIVRGGRHHRNTRGEPVVMDAVAAQFDKAAMTTPEQAAAVIWAGVLRDAPRILVGRDAHLLDVVQRLFPSSYPSLLRAGQRLVERVTGMRM